MNEDDQVTSLHISRELDRAGLRHEGLFHWTYTPMFNAYTLQRSSARRQTIADIPAFTVAELGELLPPRYISYRFDKVWFCAEMDNNVIPVMRGETEADARGKMLAYLIKNKIIKLTER